MAEKHVIKISAIISFFKDDEKLIARGENALESGHLNSTTFDADLSILRGSVHASMRDRQYSVEVSFNSDWNIVEATCTYMPKSVEVLLLLAASKENFELFDTITSEEESSSESQTESSESDYRNS
ncbi:hypothetical protein RN001_005926 [Aquatica leii]|uniref:Uncharacterized protein n=1 Tax=Aquatica leii TaxID=1421715 RepID=A0AAN7Q1Z7_9COLE|nr:hypothetical protein RN001_005926 [Aquatica leii]